MNSEAMLLWSLLFNSIGLGYFVYGRKQGNKVVLYSGVALMLYPYVFSSVLAVIGVGVLLMCLPRFFNW
ncbi:MAG: hypothetical protein P1U47_15255 [Zhongshania sp.]|uniref:hypothetical protein n=1 Tax=Zhongshania sp. TaxID=1971902 RepID=UPI00263210B4|nr:hypothetical protein [Zhongshania sp.]MDF1693737.1 hypothetical protein [Zhongshania sp.]